MHACISKVGIYCYATACLCCFISPCPCRSLLMHPTAAQALTNLPSMPGGSHTLSYYQLNYSTSHAK